MMSFDAVAKNDNFTAGQLFNNIVAFEKGVNKRYMFMPDIGASADEVLNHIKTLMIKNQHAANLKSAFGLPSNIPEKDWLIKVDETLDAMRDESFVEISGLSNIVK